MKVSILLTVLLLACYIVFAQINPPSKVRTIVINGVNYQLEMDNNRMLSTGNFNRLLNRMFGQVAVGSYSGSDLANYATFEPLNGSFAFNGFGRLSGDESKKIASFFSLNVKGGLIGNSTTQLFSNSKLNTNVSAQLKIHVMMPRKSISYFGDDKTEITNKRDSVFANALDQLRKVASKVQNNTGVLQNIRLQKSINDIRIVQLQGQLKQTRNQLGGAGIQLEVLNDSCIKMQEKIDQYEVSGYALDRKIDSLVNDSLLIAQRVGNTNETRYSQKMFYKIRQNLKASIDSVELKSKITSANFMWMSINLGTSRQKYYTFYDTLAFDQQLTENNLDAIDIGVAFNLYHQGFVSGRILYLNTGISKLKNNNTAELLTTEISDEKKTNGSGTDRKVTTKYNAYTKPIIEFKSWLFYANFYYMFGKKDKSAIHIFPEYEVRDKTFNLWNLGFGYVFSFKDKKDNKSILNVEAFVKFLDIGNKQKVDSKFKDRNNIGISVGLPFNYIL